MNALRGGRVERSILMLAILNALVFATMACREEHVEKRDITAVMDSHVGELMATPGVTGVAIGELDNGTPCILVYILQDSKGLEDKLPDTLEGYPVKTFVSGKIEPMQSDSGSS